MFLVLQLMLNWRCEGYTTLYKSWTCKNEVILLSQESLKLNRKKSISTQKFHAHKLCKHTSSSSILDLYLVSSPCNLLKNRSTTSLNRKWDCRNCSSLPRSDVSNWVKTATTSGGRPEACSMAASPRLCNSRFAASAIDEIPKKEEHYQ